MSSLGIAYLASEVAPFAKTGGLAHVSLGLPRALGKLGHEVRVFLLYYSGISYMTLPAIFGSETVQLIVLGSAEGLLLGSAG